MKKLIYLIVLALILGLVLTGCSLLSNISQVPTSPQSEITYLTRNTESDPMQVDLLAGQTEDIGDVLVWNDAEKLYVKFVYEGPECGFLEVHLQVDVGSFSPDILTKKGNPIPGKFEKSYDVGCFKEHTFTYDLAAEGFGCDDDLVIAAHAALGIEDTMTFESNVGDTVYGPINGDNVPAVWGTSGLAVRAYNWLGYLRDLTNLDQIPGCTTNPYSSPSYSWGFGLNQTYIPDIPGVLWISTAPNTEQWHLDSWRKFVENYEVPGFPISGSLQVNADNYYVVSNGVPIGSDDDIWNGPETYTFYPDKGFNILEFVTENWGQGSEANYCDQLANPNGITYKGTVSYYADGETAWGCGGINNCMGFPGKNWATYFDYTVECCFGCPDIIDNSDNIEELASPPSDVRVGKYESTGNIRVWKEFEGELVENLYYDLLEGVSARSYDFGDAIPEHFIPAGTPVCIYYVHYDSLGSTGALKEGSLTFGANILGLIISGGNLGTFADRDFMFAADDQIGDPETTYPDDTDIYPPNVDYLRGYDVKAPSNDDDAKFEGAVVNFTTWVSNAHDSMRVILPLVTVPCE